MNALVKAKPGLPAVSLFQPQPEQTRVGIDFAKEYADITVVDEYLHEVHLVTGQARLAMKAAERWVLARTTRYRCLLVYPAVLQQEFETMDWHICARVIYEMPLAGP